MYGQLKRKLPIFFLVLVAAWISVPLAALAQSASPYDLVNAVNDLRTLHGLEPYTVDPWLMAYAQEHSEYQAAIKTGTHIHSDGTRPLDVGLEENVAGGTDGFVTVDVIVYQIWADWGHRHILTGYATGEIGAGVALSDDGFVYYTVNIRTGEELAATEAPFIGLQTSTPSPDGSVIHFVGYGQTLWSIAMSYGVTIDDIRRLNGIASDSTVIQPGQQLLIRPAGAIATIPAGDTTTSASEIPVVSTAVPTRTEHPTEPASPSPTTTGIASGAALPPGGAGVVAAVVIAGIALVAATVVGLQRPLKDKTVQERDDSAAPADPAAG